MAEIPEEVVAGAKVLANSVVLEGSPLLQCLEVEVEGKDGRSGDQVEPVEEVDGSVIVQELKRKTAAARTAEDVVCDPPTRTSEANGCDMQSVTGYGNCYNAFFFAGSG